MGGIGGITQRQGTPWPVNSSLQGYHIDTNNYSHLRLLVRVINRPVPEMPDFELWEETGALGENLWRHRADMQAEQRKARGTWN